MNGIMIAKIEDMKDFFNDYHVSLKVESLWIGNQSVNVSGDIIATAILPKRFTENAILTKENDNKLLLLGNFPKAQTQEEVIKNGTIKKLFAISELMKL